MASHLPLRPLPFRPAVTDSGRAGTGAHTAGARCFASTPRRRDDADAKEAAKRPKREKEEGKDEEEHKDAIPAEELNSVGSHEQQHEHAVISTFDLFSIGGMLVTRRVLDAYLATPVGPSSSHTVGPMRAARIFVNDIKAHNILDKARTRRPTHPHALSRALSQVHSVKITL